MGDMTEQDRKILYETIGELKTEIKRLANNIENLMGNPDVGSYGRIHVVDERSRWNEDAIKNDILPRISAIEMTWAKFLGIGGLSGATGGGALYIITQVFGG